MPTYTYELPKLLDFTNSIPIKNEQSETIGYLQKRQPHPIIRATKIILSLFLEATVLPSSYEVRDLESQLLFTLRPQLHKLKNQHELTLHHANEVINIRAKAVQLIETAYHFTIDDLQFRFEQDYTGTAHLYCNEERIASARLNDDFLEGAIPSNKSRFVTITLIQSDDYYMPVLMALLYHSLFLIQ